LFFFFSVIILTTREWKREHKEIRNNKHEDTSRKGMRKHKRGSKRVHSTTGRAPYGCEDDAEVEEVVEGVDVSVLRGDTDLVVLSAVDDLL